mgnify:CR=1 FL=1
MVQSALKSDTSMRSCKHNSHKENNMIHCSKCACIYGGTGGWPMALILGWVWSRVAGKEVILCPKCKGD